MAYEKTLFYMPDEKGTFAWEGQGGGPENLNQDTWVVTYIAQIKAALSSFSLKCFCKCKGDDFRIGIPISESYLRIRSIQAWKDPGDGH